jgi:hypothetical protein
MQVKEKFIGINSQIIPDNWRFNFHSFSSLPETMIFIFSIILGPKLNSPDKKIFIKNSIKANN